MPAVMPVWGFFIGIIHFFLSCTMIWHTMLLFLHHDCESSYTINVQPIHKNMKKILLLLALMVPFVSYAQNEAEKQLTKFEQFSSKTGKISKFVDVNMPKIPKSYMGSLETGIRILMGEKNVYFYRIEEEETSRSIAHIAMIEYSDLVEINKALAVLLSEVEADCAANPDYLENKFISEDGFQVGYYVSKGSASWYMKLERYGKSTVFIKNAEAITSGFTAAQQKIEELKAQYGK